MTESTTSPTEPFADGEAVDAGAQPAPLPPDPAHPAPARIPALYIGHGAPTLVDDPVWPVELASWARELPRPRAILIVSAHWESQPLTVGATTPVPLV